MLNELVAEVAKLHQLGAYHIKRGFSLKDSKLTTASNHLIEEAVELQAEVLDGDIDSKIEEAADVLLVFLHLLKISKISLNDVIAFAFKKLTRTFTLDKTKIKTSTPGYTRKNRDENQKICDCYMDSSGPLSHWKE